MPNPGEEVSPDRSAALDALTAESERMGLYDTAPDHIGGVNEMVEAAAKAYSGAPFPSTRAINSMRAALESLGVDLAVLAELKAGTRKAVRMTTVTLPSGREGVVPNVGDVFHEMNTFIAPKTPEAAR